jgi:uncharacterized membrane protein YjjP (DUF1212 family)
MTFPFGFWDISLLVAIAAIILLVTSEILSPHYGKTNILINRKKLKKAAIIASTLFLATVAIRIAAAILLTP